jgi:ATP-dependent protease HslVU (ClpYQ) peptidase subunit
MTTIVCDKKEIACDLQLTTPQQTRLRTKTKLFEFEGGVTYPHSFIVGFAGSADEIIQAVDFFSNPQNYNKVPMVRNLNGLVLTSKQEIYLFARLDKWIRVNDSYAAIGSGSSIAIGAMTAGATVKEAVKAAIKHDINSGFGVKLMTFK